MKKIGLFLLAVLLIAGMVGCSNDKDYNFNGTWLMQKTVQSQSCNWEYAPSRVQLSQNGTSLGWTWVDSGITRYGTCDPGSESLHLRYTSNSGADIIINGLAVDGDTITGAWSGRDGPCSFSANFTLELISR